jgi:hypothetical protein
MSNRSGSLSSSNGSVRDARLRQVLTRPIRYPEDDLANHRQSISAEPEIRQGNM